MASQSLDIRKEKKNIFIETSVELVSAILAFSHKRVEDFVSCNPKELAQKCSLSYKAVVAVRRVLLAQYTAFPISGADLYEELWSSTAILSTGNTSLDKLLDSGLVAVNICHRLKLIVFYIDTKGGMCANQLLQMLQSKTPNMEEQALQKIKVFRVFDVFSLLACLQTLRSNGLQKASVGGGSVKALMVDSVSANEGIFMFLLMQVAGELNMIAKDFNIAVLVTNCVTKYGNGHLKAGLGQSWSHVPHTRVLLQRIEGAETSSLRTTTLTKSSRQACHLVEEFDLCHWSEERRTSISGKRKLEERSKP
uniref:RAD51 paralog D n=1 Tax=Cyprinus carpio TaxID=7962 RepID=A0A8C2C9U0_CYPCA